MVSLIEDPSHTQELPWERARSRVPQRCLHLVLAWSLYEPERVGESVAVHAAMALGRGASLADDPVPRAA